MQQTETYKLNLIDLDDPFLPDGLNENTRKIEGAMLAHEAAVNQKITVLEGRKLVGGIYTGNHRNESESFVSLGFQPKVCLVWPYLSGGSGPYIHYEGMEPYLSRIANEGFYVWADLNVQNTEYIFLAFN